MAGYPHVEAPDAVATTVGSPLKNPGHDADVGAMTFFTLASKRTLRSLITRLLSARILASAVLALGGGVGAVLVTVSPGQADTVPSGPTGATGPAGPPGESPCLSRRLITVHWRLHPNVKVKGFTVLVHGETYATLPASARKLTIKLVETEGPETVTVQIRARTLTGKTISNTRIYHTCVPAGPAHTGPDLFLGP